MCVCVAIIFKRLFLFLSHKSGLNKFFGSSFISRAIILPWILLPFHLYIWWSTKKKPAEKMESIANPSKKVDTPEFIFVINFLYTLVRPPARSFDLILNIHKFFAVNSKKSIEMMCVPFAWKRIIQMDGNQEKTLRFLHNVSSIVMMWINFDTF